MNFVNIKLQILILLLLIPFKSFSQTPGQYCKGVTSKELLDTIVTPIYKMGINGGPGTTTYLYTVKYCSSTSYIVRSFELSVTTAISNLELINGIMIPGPYVGSPYTTITF